MASRAPAAHRGNERNLVIILEGPVTVNVLLIDCEGDRTLKLREARSLAAKLVPERADGGRTRDLMHELGSPRALAQRREESKSYVHRYPSSSARA
jgi:hypothetical protein